MAMSTLENSKIIADGVMAYNNPSTLLRYSGDWCEDKMGGFGTLDYVNGDKYDGNLQNNLQHGEGTMTYACKNIYKGYWIDGLREGFGIFTNSDGSIIYEGDWTLDTMEGNGTLRYTSGDVYKGEFISNMEWGTRTLRCTNGYTFTGQFEKGFRHDFAVLRLVTGDVCNTNDENTWNNAPSPERDSLALSLSCEWSLKGDWQNGVFVKPLNSQGGAAMSPGRLLDDINHVEL